MLWRMNLVVYSGVVRPFLSVKEETANLSLMSKTVEVKCLSLCGYNLSGWLGTCGKYSVS